ncbi:MAG: hypothetical protein Ta2B_10520 [Termitinemataceae bacterium]|nr:MAG: hypothetical protein Ta2B_10520 [Termitinemataceae bacterium]
MGFKNKFDAGELDKWCLGAIDDPAYSRGVAHLENFNLLENGGINRRKGYQYACKILEGENNEAIKLVSVSIDDTTNYVLYVSKTKYGYVKFNKHEYVSHKEYPAPYPFEIDVDRTTSYKKADPDAFFKIISVSEISSDYDIPDNLFNIPFPVFFPYQIEEAQIKVTNKSDSEKGRLIKATDFEAYPTPFLFNGIITQPKDVYEVADGVFEEYGVGSGLIVECSMSKPNETTRMGTIKFNIIQRGSGYKPVKDNTTYLKIIIEGYTPKAGSIVKAQVNSSGEVMSIDSISYYGNFDLRYGETIWVRWLATPPEDLMIIRNVTDMADRLPDTSPEIRVNVEQTPGKSEFCENFYNIFFDVLDGGSGFTSIRSDRQVYGYGDDFVFLKLKFTGEVDEQLCNRELRCIGILKKKYVKNYTVPSKIFTYTNSAPTPVTFNIEIGEIKLHFDEDTGFTVEEYTVSIDGVEKIISEQRFPSASLNTRSVSVPTRAVTIGANTVTINTHTITFGDGSGTPEYERIKITAHNILVNSTTNTEKYEVVDEECLFVFSELLDTLESNVNRLMQISN